MMLSRSDLETTTGGATVEALAELCALEGVPELEVAVLPAKERSSFVAMEAPIASLFFRAFMAAVSPKRLSSTVEWAAIVLYFDTDLALEFIL